MVPNRPLSALPYRHGAPASIDGHALLIEAIHGRDKLSDGAVFGFVMRKQRILNGAFGAEIGQFLGELLNQLRGREAPVIAQYACQLQRVYHGLSTRVVVREDEG